MGVFKFGWLVRENFCATMPFGQRLLFFENPSAYEMKPG
jgi:hypothetical protein